MLKYKNLDIKSLVKFCISCGEDLYSYSVMYGSFSADSNTFTCRRCKFKYLDVSSSSNKDFFGSAFNQTYLDEKDPEKLKRLKEWKIYDKQNINIFHNTISENFMIFYDEFLYKFYSFCPYCGREKEFNSNNNEFSVEEFFSMDFQANMELMLKGGYLSHGHNCIYDFSLYFEEFDKRIQKKNCFSPFTRNGKYFKNKDLDILDLSTFDDEYYYCTICEVELGIESKCSKCGFQIDEELKITLKFYNYLYLIWWAGPGVYINKKPVYTKRIIVGDSQFTLMHTKNLLIDSQIIFVKHYAYNLFFKRRWILLTRFDINNKRLLVTFDWQGYQKYKSRVNWDEILSKLDNDLSKGYIDIWFAPTGFRSYNYFNNYS